MLIENALSLGNPTSEEITYNQARMLQIASAGTFDGATIQLEISQDGLSFIVVSDFAMTEDDILNVDVKGVVKYRFSLLNPGASTNINVSIL